MSLKSKRTSYIKDKSEKIYDTNSLTEKLESSLKFNDQDSKHERDDIWKPVTAIPLADLLGKSNHYKNKKSKSKPSLKLEREDVNKYVKEISSDSYLKKSNQFAAKLKELPLKRGLVKLNKSPTVPPVFDDKSWPSINPESKNNHNFDYRGKINSISTKVKDITSSHLDNSVRISSNQNIFMTSKSMEGIDKSLSEEQNINSNLISDDIEENDNNWITVEKKGKKLNTGLSEINSISENKSEQLSNDKRKELRKQNKQKLKDEKMRERERKRLKEIQQSNRDTKVTLISQSFIENYMQSKLSNSPKLPHESTNKMYTRDKPTENLTLSSRNVNRKTSDSKNESSNSQIIKNNIHEQHNRVNQIKTSKNKNRENVSKASERKKIKSKDQINLDLMTLIKTKGKKIKETENTTSRNQPAKKGNVASRTLPSSPVKRGRQNELRKKKITSLKKKIKKHLDVRQERFFKYLDSIGIDYTTELEAKLRSDSAEKSSSFPVYINFNSKSSPKKNSNSEINKDNNDDLINSKKLLHNQGEKNLFLENIVHQPFGECNIHLEVFHNPNFPASENLIDSIDLLKVNNVNTDVNFVNVGEDVKNELVLNTDENVVPKLNTENADPVEPIDDAILKINNDKIKDGNDRIDIGEFPGEDLKVDCHDCSKEEKDTTGALNLSKIKSDKTESGNAHGKELTFLKDEINVLLNPLHNRKFREYCDNYVTKEINVALVELLSQLVKFQARLFQNEPIKAKSKRRYICGLKETVKHINKLTFVIIVPDISYRAYDNGLKNLIKILKEKSKENNYEIFYGASINNLGKILHKKAFVSCVGICNYQGAQELYNKTLELVKVQRTEYINALKAVEEKQNIPAKL